MVPRRLSAVAGCSRGLRVVRVSRPIYETLPYVYMGLGVGALAFSFFWREPGWSDAVMGFGLLALVGGLVVSG